MSKIYSPFEDSGFFGLNNIVGRENLLSYFNSQLIEKNYSKPSYFLITGNDRMGKSSFLKYFDKFTNDLDYLSAFVYVDENEINDIDFIIQKIISNIIFNLKNRYLKYSFKELKENREIVEQDKYCYEEIISELEESIVNIGYSEINFKKSFISYVKNNFVEFMMYLMSKINHKGIHIQLDTHESFKNVKSLSLFLKWFGNIVNDLNNLKKEIPIIFTFVFPKNVSAPPVTTPVPFDLPFCNNTATIKNNAESNNSMPRKIFIINPP